MRAHDGVTTPSRMAAALAGIGAGAAALGVSELAAAVVPGATSPILAVGDTVIALQPPGAKQFVVDLVGEADKLVLNVFIGAVALALAAGVGVLARRRPGLAKATIVLGGILAVAAALRDPLADALPSFLVAVAAVAVAVVVLGWLLGLVRSRAQPPVAEMPDWARRRFLGGTITIGIAGVAASAVGRTLLERGRAASTVPLGDIPGPAETAAPLGDGTSLDVEGITPIVVPNERFYRIDTALLVPRPDVDSWRLSVAGMVDRPFELTYNELVAMPLHEEYVTIACVSNEVGGGLVGNALWTGVRLKELLQRAGVQSQATQIVGRAVDGFTVGFPTAHALADNREPLVAVLMNGDPLPSEHGFPARLIVPGLFGYVSATKWLTEIELSTLEAFDAYWIPLGWSKLGPILTQSRIDTPRDGSGLSAGTVAVAGVAWAPDRGVEGVEVQVDDGDWQAAELSTPISAATWVQWVLRWEAAAGDHVLRVRATDGTGMVQTADVTRPAPDGARGYHTIRVNVG
jgi:DMSO/TMAO reductase YedYZ molybdopterin-dependent catalytic subunit